MHRWAAPVSIVRSGNCGASSSRRYWALSASQWIIAASADMHQFAYSGWQGGRCTLARRAGTSSALKNKPMPGRGNGTPLGIFSFSGSIWGVLED